MYSQMLRAYGLTPQEWHELPGHTQVFFEMSFMKEKELEAEELDDIDD